MQHIFKRPSSRYGKTPPPETPYQRAAQVWDDRMGAARLQAKNWRLMAFGNLFLTAGFASALVIQSMRGTVVPWVVEVNKLGEARTVAPAFDHFTPTDTQIAWYLAHFIKQVRSIPNDAIVVRQNWLNAYEYTTSNGAAALNGYAQANDPFPKIGKQQVTVEVSSVIRASPASFRIAWIERTYTDGSLAATEHWTAILTLIIEPPKDAAKLRANPLGIYVNAINWSKELAE